MSLLTLWIWKDEQASVTCLNRFIAMGMSVDEGDGGCIVWSENNAFARQIGSPDFYWDNNYEQFKKGNICSAMIKNWSKSMYFPTVLNTTLLESNTQSLDFWILEHLHRAANLTWILSIYSGRVLFWPCLVHCVREIMQIFPNLLWFLC